MATTNHKQTSSNSNPWKGLNFYQEGEILYGRDEEIQSLSLYITNNIQTVLYGKSGIGKSSVINAGVFPIARKEGLYPVPIRLKHDKESSYIEQIRNAFTDSGLGIREIVPVIHETKESLWEYLHRHSFYNVETNESVRPLIVLDQFEEIFTLQQDESKKKDFFSELADLLNEVTPQYIINANNESRQSKILKPKARNSSFVLDLGSNETEETEEYVSESLFNIVFTIREDFLSYLERYTKFIPVMKSNRYALLPLNEEQAKDIIMKPVPGLVDINVAKLIIEKVTGRTDFNLNGVPELDVDAAVLSLYLSRLFDKRGEGNVSITTELVDESSKDIIKDFYEESVSDLPMSDIEEIEDQLLTYDGLRNNVSRNDLIREGVSEKTIHLLVEEKKLLRQFNYQNDIRIEFMHDILCPIVDDRIEHREQLEKEREAKHIEEENKQIKLQNDKLNKIRSLFLSEKAINCFQDRYLAQKLALEALPLDIEHPDKPLVPQAETALRKTQLIPFCPMMNHTDFVTNVLGTADGTQVLSSSRDGKICVWDAFSGGKLKELDYGENTVFTMSIKNDGCKIGVVFSKGVIQLYTLDDFKMIDEFSCRESLPTSLALSPDGSIIAIGFEDGKVFFRSLGQEMRQTQSSIKNIEVLMFSPNGNEIVALGERNMEYCSMEKGVWSRLDDGTIYGFTCISYSKNGKYLFCGTENGKVVVIENSKVIRKKIDVLEFEGADSKIGTISISGDTKKLAYSVGGKLIIRECDTRFGWNPQEAKEKGLEYPSSKTYILNDEFAPIITSVAWSADDRFVIWGNAEGFVAKYDLKPGPQHRQLLKATSFMKALEYSPNGDNIYCMSFHNTVRIIDIKSGKVLYRESHANKHTLGKEVQSVDGKFTAVYNKNQRLLELFEGNVQKAKHTFAIEGETTSIAFSSDASLLAISTKEGIMMCWDTDKGKLKYKLNGNKSLYNTLIFSPNGRIVAATGPKREVLLLDEKSGTPCYAIPAAKGYVSALAFSPNGDRLAVGMETGVIRIWNTMTKEQVEILDLNREGVSVKCMSFSPDGEQLSASYSDGSLFVWECPSLKALISDIRQKMIIRRFTDEEKKRYYLEDY